MKVVDLKAIVKVRGLRGYSKLKKAELIAFLQNNFRPTPRPMPAPRSMPAPRPIRAPRPTPAPRPKPKSKTLPAKI